MFNIDGRGQSVRQGMFRALQSTQYRWLWLCATLGGIANWALLMGNSWITDNLSGSSLWVGLTVFAQMFPAVFMAPLAGLLNDKFDRRTVLVGAVAVGTITVGALALFANAGRLTIPGLALGGLLFGTAHTLQIASTSSMLPRLIKRDVLLNGVAMLRVASHGTMLVGAAVAGPLLAGVGAFGVFLLAFIISLISLFATTRINSMRTAGQAASRVALLDAVKHINRTPGLGLILILVAFHCVLTMSYMSLLPNYVQSVFGHGSELYARIMFWVGLGSTIGAIAILRVSSLHARGQWYIYTSIGSGLFLATLFYSPNVFSLLVSAFLVGSTQTIFMALSAVWAQELTVDLYRGRITGIYMLLSGGTMSLANWGFGAIGMYFNPSLLMAIVGMAYVLITLGYMIWSPHMKFIMAGKPFPTPALSPMETKSQAMEPIARGLN